MTAIFKAISNTHSRQGKQLCKSKVNTGIRTSVLVSTLHSLIKAISNSEKPVSESPVSGRIGESKQTGPCLCRNLIDLGAGRLAPISGSRLSHLGGPCGCCPGRPKKICSNAENYTLFPSSRRVALPEERKQPKTALSSKTNNPTLPGFRRTFTRAWLLAGKHRGEERED